MKLGDAKCCVECEEIFEEGEQCPKCTGTAWGYVNRWMAECHKIIGDVKLNVQAADVRLAQAWEKTGGRG